MFDIFWQLGIDCIRRATYTVWAWPSPRPGLVAQPTRWILCEPRDVQNLSDAHGAAALAQSALHRLARAQNRHATDPALERDARVRQPRWGHHRLLEHREVVEAWVRRCTYPLRRAGG